MSPTPPHIALIRQKYNAAGGAERFVSRAIAALSAGGARVTLLTRKWEKLEGMSAIRVNPFYLGNVWRDWSFARAVAKAQQGQGFDLVQSHERLTACDVYRAGDGVHREWLRQRGRVMGRWGRLKLWLNPYHHYVLHAEAAMFTSARLKAVICNSKMVAEEIRQDFGLPESKLHVIYSGIDSEQFHPGLRVAYRSKLRATLQIDDHLPVFIYVGSGFERKGVASALRALAALGGQANLILVGHDKKAAHYQALARALGVAQRCHFVGAQPDVKPYYAAADALLLPTLYDPFPNVVLEAMACGLPVITSTKCGAAELIEEGKQGFVRDALDIGGLRDAMQVLCDPAQAQVMGQASREWVLAMTPQKMAAEMTALYQALLARSS
ncbi:UDP-glucose:(heptosyl)LPS alpha-1,3-glucosyltransferase [Chitinivorax tropicus]|uniref:UDP-glucose:(Heptosyl)LPS alpha-1,3-glucosyltransferase n=1 Tax=Chitinivorax tropicus TaxID=714531 RepID=A0A840MEE9_9PROT|nr:glycosyltransferase family 4 protein [Chitinivorax tropicus]MBB5017058.1 UDP-glucose:(heptosyl)LPS alpha-1,3-glucosyltransferase [Chitinivorax tropicus]